MTEPLAKIGLRGSLADEQASRKGERLRQRRAAYAAVDARDHHQCRVCGARLTPTASWHERKTQRHHMLRRRYEGADSSANIVTICPPCHRLIHDYGTLRVSGNADRLGELVVERRDGNDWYTEPEYFLREAPPKRV